MTPSVLGKRRVGVLEEEELTAIPSPRSNKRLRNLQIHEEVDENDGGDSPRVTRSTAKSLKAGVQGVIDIDGVNNENREPAPEPENNEDAAIVDEPSRIVPNPRAEFTTPHKSRFRDALAPVQGVKSPSTPRHRVIVGAKPLTPRTPRTPRGGPVYTTTVYTPAKKLFARNSWPDQLVGRETEQEELRNAIRDTLGNCKGSCVYVSGPPGTGKSAVVDGLERGRNLDKILQDKLDRKDIKSVRTEYFNCASMTDASGIYRRLLERFTMNDSDYHYFMGTEASVLRGLFLSRSKKDAGIFYVITLDEIDHLMPPEKSARKRSSGKGSVESSSASANASVLSTLFEWSVAPSSRLLLIGIANALDLTKRLLPPLTARNMKPILIPFKPYTPAQISQIITHKLRSLLPKPEENTIDDGAKVPADFTPFLHPAAIQLCARKVASTTGDLRKAFEVVQRTIELIEKETMQQRYAAGLAKTATANATEPESPTKQKTAATTTTTITSSKTPLFENANLAMRPTPPETPFTSQEQKPDTATAPVLPVLTPANAPRATVVHVARVTSSLFGNGTTVRLADLNLQQKAALCVLLAHQKKVDAQLQLAAEQEKEKESRGGPRTRGKRAAAAAAAAVDQPTVKHVFSVYVSLCKKDNALAPLSASEFNDVISSLETSGLVGVQNKGSKPVTPSLKPRRSVKVKGEALIECYVSEKEVLDALKGAGEGVLMKLVRNFE
ncbi:AAA ATPase [Ascosphaera pollenicola]|nr:AAA ATPase [Ascosphaera pollenicola]